MLTKILTDRSRTLAFGRQLGSFAQPGDVITLGGELGAGKTTLVQAIGLALDVPSSCYITSPSFSLLHEYPGRMPLYHMDLYRLAGDEEMEELGFEEYLYGAGLTVVEWPDRLGRYMPAERLHVELSIIDEDSRQALITPHGETWKKRLAYPGAIE